VFLSLLVSPSSTSPPAPSNFLALVLKEIFHPFPLHDVFFWGFGLLLHFFPGPPPPPLFSPPVPTHVFTHPMAFTFPEALFQKNHPPTRKTPRTRASSDPSSPSSSTPFCIAPPFHPLATSSIFQITLR